VAEGQIVTSIESLKQQLTHWRTELAFRVSGTVYHTEASIEEARVMVRRLSAEIESRKRDGE